MSFTKSQQEAIEKITKFTKEPFNPAKYMVGLTGRPGVGKALRHGTPVLTNSGWKPIEELTYEDKVMTPYHGYSSITGIFPQGKRPIYRIEFIDGRTIDCDENHLWLIRTPRQKQHLREKLHKINIISTIVDREKQHSDKKFKNIVNSSIVSTKTIYDNREHLQCELNGNYLYATPTARIEYPEKDLIIPPYVLGVLLGDGILTNNITKKPSSCLYISSDEVDIIEKVANLLNADYRWHKDYNYTNIIYGETVRDVNAELDRCNLKCTALYKYIPEEYIYSSVEQRIDLLKGLMDTDGNIDNKHKHRLRYYTISPRLRDDIITICRSLGICATYSTDNRGKNPCYCISLQTGECLFSSKKHLDKWGEVTDKKITHYNDHLPIIGITKLDEVDYTTCIAVEDEDKLFITKDYIVTHNTYITKHIIDNCGYSNSVIKCTSSTHKACRIFSQALGGKPVDTIQSTFGLRLDLNLEDFDPYNPQFNPKAKPKLNNIKFLIIDEASMLPAKLVTFIAKTCKFLGIKILFIGDSDQLAPVNENKSIAFSVCSELYVLKEIMRQVKNNPITGLLDLLKNDIKNKTYNFIQYVSTHVGTTCYNDFGEGFCICDANSFVELIRNSFSKEDYAKNIDMYRIISYTNDNVNGWNRFVRKNLIKDADKQIITKNDLIMSYETIVNEFMDIIINNSEEYIVHDIADYTDDTYGFKGFLVRLQLIHGGTVTKPLFIIDHTDKNTILAYHNKMTKLVSTAKGAQGNVRVSKWKEYFDFKKKYLLISNIKNREGKLLYSRDVDYGFAITAHKSQGSTYDNVFVDTRDMIFNKNNIIYPDQDDLLRRLYVACSRASKELILYY